MISDTVARAITMLTAASAAIHQTK